MEKVLNKANEENITNMTLYLYLSRYSGLVVEKVTLEAKIGYDTAGYRRLKKEFKEDIKRLKTIDELPMKWTKYFEEAEEEVIINREKYATRRKLQRISHSISK